MNLTSSSRMKETAGIGNQQFPAIFSMNKNSVSGIAQIVRALWLILLVGFLFPFVLLGQTDRNAGNNNRQHCPKKASIFSAILPGLGQAYNRKYWKIPVIYGGFGAIAFITRENTIEYRYFLEAYRYVANNETYPIDNPYVGRYNEQQLLSGKNLYRRNVEIGYILGGALYILNIIDASVDAHLFYHDVSETLSMKLAPSLLQGAMANRTHAGISITFRF